MSTSNELKKKFDGQVCEKEKKRREEKRREEKAH
jgi:hypothetical protein